MTTALPDPAFRIHDLISMHLPHLADHTAFVEGSSRWTYGAFQSTLDALASFLKDAGLKPGDRLMIVGENSVAQLAAIMAASRLNAWAVIVNARLSANEIAGIESHCDPRLALFTHATSDDALTHGQARNAAVHHVAGIDFSLTPARAEAAEEPVVADCREQVAALIYTTGTTGNPKAVMLTHANLGFTSATSRLARNTNEDDVIYAALPLSHVYGLTTVVLSGLWGGATLHLVARFDAHHLLQALSEGLTFFMGVPAMYLRLLALHEGGEAVHAPRLRFVHCGGAPLDPALKNRVEAMFNLPINNGYGMTEASPTITVVPYNQRCDDMTVGYPIPELETRVVDDQGRPVAQGEVGELLIRGPNVMKGYYKAPEQTAAVLSPDGWLSTNDLVRQAPDGAFYIMGRLKDLIIRSGFNVYPSEVEAALNAHPSVVQSCVVGKAVESDEQVIAFVEVDPHVPFDEVAVKAFVAERLAPYKRPQRIIPIDRLPAAQSGKVLKKAVQDMAAQL
jgi:long-chain acyl-CoA synthetase